MKLSFEDNQRLRQAIIDYVGNLDEEQVRKLRTPELEAHLKQNGFPELTIDQLSNSLYASESFGSFNKPEEDYFVPSLSRRLANENKSLARIDQLFGKNVLEMGTDELKAAAIQMFILTIDNYKDILAQKGIAVDEGYWYVDNTDSEILIDILTKKGIAYPRKELRVDVLKRNYGLGYFEKSFKSGFAYFSEDEFMNEGIDDLHNVLGREYHQSKENLEKHMAFDAKLKEQHTIKAPELLADKTLELGAFAPCAIEFAHDGSLIVMGYDAKGDEDHTELALMRYDLNTQALLNPIRTKLTPHFTGIMGADSFHGSLTVGSDGIIYVNGGKKRYSPYLEEIVGNESGFKDALNIVEKKSYGWESDRDLLGWSDRIYIVVESDGIFYFATQPDNPPSCYRNKLIAASGKKIIGSPLMDYSPSGGSNCSCDDETPRLVIHGDSLFYKDDKNIIKVKKGFSKKNWEDSQIILNTTTPEKPGLDYIPSKHCISPMGTLYAVSNLPDEPAQSIKGYDISSGKAVFATHVYPENHPGGWGALRSMAISKDNILAYTSLDDHNNGIHFYKLER